MKIAFLTDIHVSDRDDKCASVIAEVKSHVLQAKPDVVLLGGDYAGHSVPHKASPNERNILTDLIVGLAAQCPVVAVRGNHDTIGDYAYWNHLRGVAVMYCETPEWIEVPTKGGTVGIAALPWIDQSRLPQSKAQYEYHEGVRLHYGEFLDSIRSDAVALKRAGGVSVALCHGTFDGALLREGQPRVPTADPVVDPNWIARPEMFDVMMAGHYHWHQKIKAPIPAFYGGSLLVAQFGEDFPKGWVMYDSATREYTHVTSAAQRVKVRAKLDPVTGKVIDVAPKSIVRNPSGMDAIALQRALIATGYNFEIKLVTDYNEADSGAASETLAKFKSCMADIAARIDVDATVQPTTNMRTGAAEVSSAASLPDKFAAYCQQRSQRRIDVEERAAELLATIPL